MKKITSLTLLIGLILLSSCGTMQTPTTSMTNYYNQAPDLSNVKYEGGNGTSVETAIIIKNAGNERNGIAAEYAYISKIHGQKFTTWKPSGSSTNLMNGKKYDIISITILPRNEQKMYYFDITDFYGKF